MRRRWERSGNGPLGVWRRVKPASPHATSTTERGRDLHRAVQVARSSSERLCQKTGVIVASFPRVATTGSRSGAATGGSQLHAFVGSHSRCIGHSWTVAQESLCSSLEPRGEPYRLGQGETAYWVGLFT